MEVGVISQLAIFQRCGRIVILHHYTIAKVCNRIVMQPHTVATSLQYYNVAQHDSVAAAE
jgi:hypothetical protein